MTSPGRAAAPPRIIVDGPTRVDRQSHELSRALGGIVFPRSWAAAPRYDELAVREVERILAERGDAAFLASNGDGESLLVREMFEGSERIRLGSSAAAALVRSAGSVGFRRVSCDDDGRSREYWVRLVATRRGIVELRLTWYGSVVPMLDADGITRGEACPSRAGGAVHYEGLGDEDQRRVDRWVAEMAGVRGARAVLERVLFEFGRSGENPVRLSMRELRLLVRSDCDSDRGVRRVLGCLRALQELRYDLHNVSGAHLRAFGPCIAGVWHVGRGRGAHAEGDVYVEVSTPFVGCLSVFADTPPEVSPRRRYNWAKKLGRSERAELRGNYATMPSALLPSYAVAVGLTQVEFDLLEWIDGQLTRERDASRSANRARGNRSDVLREYEGTFCPLLPAGRRYFAALGHFNRSAEAGFSLLGTRRTSAGIASALGAGAPPPHARRAVAAICDRLLIALRHLVVDIEGGILAARSRDGHWLTPDEARGLQVRDLAYGVRWYIFLPTDVYEARRKAIEDYAAARHRVAGHGGRIRVVAEGPRAGDAERDLGHVPSAGLTLGERLRAARLAHGLTLDAVARDLGVSHTTISNWERGIREDADGVSRGKHIPATRAPSVEKWVAAHGGPARTDARAVQH